MLETFETYNLTSGDANTTKIIRKKGENSDGVFGFLTVFKDTAHTIAFYNGDPTAGGELLFTKPASMAAGTYKVMRSIKNGLYAVVAASYAGDAIVGFR